MKILFIGPLPDPVTGQSLACKVLFEHLSKEGNALDVINLSKPQFQGGVRSLNRVFQILFIAIKILFLSRKADVIYFTISESLAGNLKDILIYLACTGRLRRMVVHLHGGAGMVRLLADNRPLRCINRFFLTRMAGVIVLGDRLKKIYKDIVSDDKLHAVPNFSQDDFFVSDELVNEKFATIKPLRLLFLSNLLPGKGHEELLAAMTLLPSDVSSKIQLDFAGGFESGAAEKTFRERVKSAGHDFIYVHGIVRGEKKRELLQDAHLFCLPTYYPYEGQPISILEAYASGCCVMTTDHSGIFDIFTPEVNGIQVEPRSPSSIAHALTNAVRQPQALSAYAVNNLGQARLRYRVSTHVRALEEVISSVASKS